VTDKHLVVARAGRLETDLAKTGRTAPVQVCVIRLITSRYGDPDTKALACLGQLNTMGTVFPLDIDTSTTTDYPKLMIKEIIRVFKLSLTLSLFSSLVIIDILSPT